jgi:hypothetical protein
MVSVGERAEDGPDVLGCLEILPAVARLVDQAHQVPGLQLFQAHAHVRARETQRRADLVGIARLGGHIQEGVDLADRAVDAPAAAHFAEMHDETLGKGGEVHVGFSEFSVFSENSGISVDRAGHP